MKPLVIYASQTGNTFEVAEAMAAAIQADLKRAQDITAADLEGRELIGLGSGIYTLQHLPPIRRLVPRLPAGCKVFIFSTSGLAGQLPAAAHRITHWRLRRALRGRKIAIMGEWNCPGQVKGGIYGWFGLYRGRPNDADLASAANFARQAAGQSPVSANEEGA